MTPDHPTPATTPHRSLVGLVRACHFQPTLAVTAVTTGLAALAGRSAWGCVAVAVAVLAGQLSTGWSNDWFDAARDTANGRTDKPIVSGAVDVSTVRAAALAALVGLRPAVAPVRVAGRRGPPGGRRLGLGLQRRGQGHRPQPTPLRRVLRPAARPSSPSACPAIRGRGRR